MEAKDSPGAEAWWSWNQLFLSFSDVSLIQVPGADGNTGAVASRNVGKPRHS